MQRKRRVDAEAWSEGVDRLGDDELLYLVLRLGSSEETAWSQACRSMGNHRDFHRELRRGNWQHFIDSGMSRPQCSALFAAMEIARRSSYRLLPLSNPFRSSMQIYEYFKPLTSDLKKECFWAVLLDGRNRIIRVVKISEGTLTSSLVHPREVFRPAILEAAASMIFVHNHPTGEPDPSPEDISITRRLVEAGKLVGISVLDHVIMGNCRHFSFADEGLLKASPGRPSPRG